MKTFSIHQLKRRLGEALGDVAAAPIMVTRYRRPVAVIVSPARYRALCEAARAAQAGALDRYAEETVRRGAPRSLTRSLVAAMREE